MNIDKDIERVKELAKNLKEKFKRISGAIAIMPRIEEEDVQAIENVLSELESHKGKIILSDEEYNKVIENAQKDIKKEVETWKKIAEKLAEEYYLNNNNHILGSVEDVIDWAKREVLKDE